MASYKDCVWATFLKSRDGWKPLLEVFFDSHLFKAWHKLNPLDHQATLFSIWSYHSWAVSSSAHTPLPDKEHVHAASRKARHQDTRYQVYDYVNHSQSSQEACTRVSRRKSLKAGLSPHTSRNRRSWESNFPQSACSQVWCLCESAHLSARNR